MATNLVLFGKHPAWSDHMFLSDDSSVSHYLKRILYDNSVIPALQVGHGDQRISETWSFLVYINEQVFFIVNAISRDSVGRRRFPLVVAYPLPAEIKPESSLDQLRELKKELLALLAEMLEAPGENLNQWQEEVNRKLKSFKSKVDWSAVKSSEADLQLKRDVVASLMSRLANDNNAINLKSCPFAEACGLAQLGLKQFKSKPSAMLILDKDDNGLGLLFSTEGVSFNFKRHLYNNLTSLAVAENNLHPKVSRLLKSTTDKELLSVDKIPSLKLDENGSSSSRKLIILAAFALLTILILLGLFLGKSERRPVSEDVTVMKSTKLLSAQERWSLNATAYIEWIQPLIDYVNSQPKPISKFDSVAAILEKDLNPFAAVGMKEASLKLTKNPPDYFFSPENNVKLNKIHDTIDQLRTSLVAYYKTQFSDKLVKILKRKNYPCPSFLEVDFSEQPIQPQFGPQLVSQFETLINSQIILNDLVETTKGLWFTVIKPLHQICPEHAKFIQRYVQKVITESKNMEQLESQSAALLEIFGYPNFINLDDIDVDKLSKNPEWMGLPGEEQSLESMRKLVELIKSNQINEVEDQPTEAIKKKIPVVEVSQTAKQVSTLDEQAVKSGEQALNLSKQVLKSGEKMAESGDAALESVIDLSEWNLFLETGLEQLKDNRLISEVKSHSEVVKSKLLDDPSIEIAQAFAKFKEQTTNLIAAFRELDVSSMQKSSGLYSGYLEKAASAKYLSDYMFDEYKAANIGMGDVKTISKVNQEINAGVDAYLTALYDLFDKLETSFFSAKTDSSNDDIVEDIYKITENSLYVEGMFGSRLEIIKVAIAGNEIDIKTAQDLAWYAKNIAKKDVVDSKQMAIVITAFNGLDSADQTSELDNLVRSVFDKYTKELCSSNPEAFLTLYKDLSAYLPERLHLPQDQGFQQIAEHWSRYSKDTKATIPTREKLEAIKYSTESNIAKQFYAGLIAEYDKINARTSGTFLSEIEKNDGVKSVLISEDKSQLDVVFEGDFGKLPFLAVEVEGKVIFIQQSPLSLQQYIDLSNICNFDTEYYLTLQDSFWPRSFEVGMGLGFLPLREWQFRSREVFTSIAAFNKKTLPAHLNEPTGILKMAQFFNFRLLKPDECETFIRLADKLSMKTLEFTVEDKRNLERFKAIKSSVYSTLIAESIEKNDWFGGIDFERGVPGGKQFFDVVGGSAELAYDGKDFYVFGGSWLYKPEILEKPVRITEPKRMYMDLGVRFVIDSPTQSYSELVQKVALQVLAESR